MKHPFQRKSNKKKTINTPFQKALVTCIQDYAADGEMMSGRQLSSLLGKSANHISQMLNDGFVPSGPTIIEMAEVLELDDEARDTLIRAAMATKAKQRSRDNFWITETQRMLENRDRDLELFAAFVEKEGLTAKFNRSRAAKKRRSKKSS